jgi:hypothetical protein
MTNPWARQSLLCGRKLGVGLEATFGDVDAFVLSLFRYADTKRFLDRAPDDEVGNEDPGKERIQCISQLCDLPGKLGLTTINGTGVFAPAAVSSSHERQFNRRSREKTR